MGAIIYSIGLLVFVMAVAYIVERPDKPPPRKNPLPRDWGNKEMVLTDKPIVFEWKEGRFEPSQSITLTEEQIMQIAEEVSKVIIKETEKWRN